MVGFVSNLFGIVRGGRVLGGDGWLVMSRNRYSRHFMLPL